MAKDTSARVALTQAIVDGLRFDRPVSGVDETGKLLTLKSAGDKRDWTLRDASTPGFSVRVHKGKAVYQVQRKMGMRVDAINAARSAPIRRVIGNTATIKLVEARRTAQLWLGQMAQGIDPHQHLREKAMDAADRTKKEKTTFGQVYEAYAKDGTGITDATLKDRQKVVRWMKKSPLWRHSIFKINTTAIKPSIATLFEASINSSPAPDWAPGTPGLATCWKIFRHTAAAYRTFLGTQEVELARRTSPFAQVQQKYKWPAVERRTTFLDTREDTHIAWLNALNAARDHIDPAKQVMADFLLLDLIWGGRKRELQLLRWADLDLKKDIGSFIAINRKHKKIHYFPITPWAKEIVVQRRERNIAWGREGEWVFPSDHHGKPLHHYRGLVEHLEEKVGVWLTSQDLRRTLATETMEFTGSEMFVAMALGHSKAGSDVSMGYVQRRVRLMRPLFERHEKELRKRMGLDPMNEKATAIDALIEFLTEGRGDPAEAIFLERQAQGMLMMLNKQG